MLEPLAPAEAAQQFTENPFSVLLSLAEILRCTGLTWPELRAQLREGHLRASGVPDGAGGFSAVAVPAGELLRWLNDGATDTARKAATAFDALSAEIANG